MVRLIYSNIIPAAFKCSLALTLLALAAGCNLPLKPRPNEGAAPIGSTPQVSGKPAQPNAGPTADGFVPGSGGESGSPGGNPQASLESSLLGVTVVPFTAEGGLQPMLAAGLHWTRRTLKWAPVEPEPGQRRWDAVSDLDAEIMAASAAGVEMILVLEDTPAWAIKSGYSCNIVAEDHLSDAARFTADWVARYSKPPFNVHYFELWNEPDAFNVLGCWGDPQDDYFGGRYYGQMLQTAYPAMKSADPSAQILVGGLLMDCTPENTPDRCSGLNGRFMEGILVSGAASAFDGISFHAYDYYLDPGQYGNANWNASWDTTGPSGTVKAAYLRRLLSQYEVTGKYLMNTETALLCGKPDVPDPKCQSPEYEATKSAYLVQAFAAAYHDNLRANLWYTATGWRSSGLVTPEGGTTPAYQAYRFLFSQLSQASIANDSSTAAIQGYDFTRPDGRHVWLMWSADGLSQFVSLPDLPLTVYSATGERLGMSGGVQGMLIDWSPVYVVFE